MDSCAFLIAEEATKGVINALLDEGASVLYQRYIERKTFPYSGDLGISALLGECHMAYKPCPMPAQGDWELEMKPVSATIDSWARACVPIRREGDKLKDLRPPELRDINLQAKEVKHTSPMKSSLTKQVRTPVSAAMKDVPAGDLLLSRISLLKTEEEVDEEEMIWRDAKDREAKRKREADARRSRQKKEEEEETLKMSKAKDETKNKQCTYDSNGNTIWVTPVNEGKLPATTSTMNYRFSSKAGVPNTIEQSPAPKKQKMAMKQKNNNLLAGMKDDTFQRLAPQQPSMYESMALAPGVTLEDRGRTRKAEVREPKGAMTRLQYEQLVFSVATNASVLPQAQAEPQLTKKIEATMETQDIPIADLIPPVPAEPKVEVSKESKEELSRKKSDVQFQSTDQKQPMMPTKIHDSKNKFLAIGYRPGQRDRMPISGTARMAQGLYGPSAPHFAPPPTGATMGHGLMGDTDEFYFPNKPVKQKDESIEDSPKSIQHKRKPNPRKPMERVVSTARTRQFVENLKYG